MNRHKCSLCDIFNISRIAGFIIKRVFNCSTDSSLQQADFPRECVMVRDGLFTLSNWFLISDIDAIIDCLCCDKLSLVIDLILIYLHNFVLLYFV